MELGKRPLHKRLTDRAVLLALKTAGIVTVTTPNHTWDDVQQRPWSFPESNQPR